MRLAAVPTALPIIAKLTTPLRDLHPEVTFTVRSCTSGEVLGLLENLEIDAGVTYVGNEPLGRVRHVPLYDERYALVVAADDPTGHAHVHRLGGCRRRPPLPADPGHAKPPNHRSAFAASRAGAASRVGIQLADGAGFPGPHRPLGQRAADIDGRGTAGDAMGPDAPIRAVPIQESEASPVIGLVYPLREPLSPLTAALVTEARRLSESKSATATG